MHTFPWAAELITRALHEDLGHADITAAALVPATARATAEIIARQATVAAALPIAAQVFTTVDPQAVCQLLVDEGTRVAADTVLLRVSGSARALLSAERVALNIAQRACGIAELTATFVAAVAHTRATILDTRKTTPGLRMLEKYAVRTGGGTNHRFGLYDAVLIKDNHLAFLASTGATIADAIQRARQYVGPLVIIEIEVETVEDAQRAAEAGADMIMLDNMTLAALRCAVTAIAGRARVEASGGVSLSTVRAIAETGVDYISVGALTHSARAADLSLDLVATIR